jgi:thymidylate synthase (FAD)
MKLENNLEEAWRILGRLERTQKEIKVLDYGHIRLVDSMGTDLSAVRSARVSYNAEWRAGQDEKSDEKLIRYLWTNGHTTPFESITFTFDVKAPIFVYRQWHRHRTQSYNEVSARYTQLPEEYYIPEPHLIGTQSKSNKQMRDIAEDAGCTPIDLQYISDLQSHSGSGFALYQYHIKNGVPRELARLFLGLNTYSHMFATMNLLNCLKFLRLRLHSHAQHEIRVYAEAMLELIEPIVPVTVAVFKETL